MRKISERAALNFLAGARFKAGDTAVQPHYNGSALFVIFGTEVGHMDAWGQFSTCIPTRDANTQTTRERLNTVWEVETKTRPYSTKGGKLFFNGQRIEYGQKARYNHFTRTTSLDEAA